MIFEFSKFELPKIADKLSGRKYEEFKKTLVALLFTQRTQVFETANKGTWPELKVISLRRGGKTLKAEILRDKGILMGSFTDAGGPGSQFKEIIIEVDEVGIATNVEYAAIQNFGGVINHPGTQDGFGRGIEIPAHPIVIPARPFDQFSAENIKEISELTELYLNGEI